MSTLPKARLTAEQYLEIEDVAEYKSEYYQGQMFARPDTDYSHNLIAANALGEIGQQLRDRPFTVCPSNMRMHIPRTGLFTYPDGVVICGEARFLDQKKMTLLNPTLIVEVLSPSTEAYDRGRKFEHYQSIESLREYLLISSDRVSVTLHRRQSEREWLTITATSPESTIELESAGCQLAVRTLYGRVEFSSAAQDSL